MTGLDLLGRDEIAPAIVRGNLTRNEPDVDAVKNASELATSDRCANYNLCFLTGPDSIFNWYYLDQ